MKSYNNNEPRLKGNSIINNENFTEITKGIFTTCKKRDGCPPWEIAAKKIT
jgi:LPS-assembly protein